MGFNWDKVRYSDPRAKRDVIKFERCAFRQAQDNGLDPTTLISMDESNFHIFDQPRNAWGTTAKPATLEKPKGKTLRNTVYATIGFKIINGQAKALIHWVFIHPRKTWRPLPDEIQEYEIEPEEKTDIKASLSNPVIDALSTAGLKAKLCELGIRAPTVDRDSMRDVLRRVTRKGTRLGELRVRGKGRPDKGGMLVPPTGDARMASEYLHECLAPYLEGKGLLNGDTAECKGTADEGMEGCPDGGKREFVPVLGDYSLLWDGAPSHLPSTHTHISAFHKYAQDKLGFKGVISTPPYSAWYNPVELFFSYTKRYIRKHAPATVPELVQRLKEATLKVTGEIIKGWFKKSGFVIPGEAEVERPPDPNAGVVDRCSLPADALFQRREHIVCYSSQGKLRREKKKGRTRWNKYDDIDDDDEDDGDLENLSVSKRKAVRPTKRQKVNNCPPPEEGKTRWTGLGPEPGGGLDEFPHGDQSGLWQDHDDNEAVDAVVGERTVGGKTEYKVRWVGFDASHDEWLPAERFTAGLNSIVKNWQARNKRRAEAQQISKNSLAGKPTAYKPDRKAKKGDVVAIYAGGKSKKGFFFMGEVLDMMPQGKLRVHWWGSKKLDAVWSKEYKQHKGGKQVKGHAGPHTGAIELASVMDRVPSLNAQRRARFQQNNWPS
jgi:transposase